MTLEFNAVQTFEPKTARQMLNATSTVFHCHHYSTLFTQLADDAGAFGGAKLLAEAAEEFAFNELTAYFNAANVNKLQARLAIVESYYGFVGLGALKIDFDGQAGSAEMQHSHVDEGWLKKWGKRDRSVNFIGQGFIAGACAAASGSKLGVFDVDETQSIVTGASCSKFTISAKRGAL
jgi:hypothetical protein